jgi:hypothetical protein
MVELREIAIDNDRHLEIRRSENRSARTASAVSRPRSSSASGRSSIAILRTSSRLARATRPRH